MTKANFPQKFMDPNAIGNLHNSSYVHTRNWDHFGPLASGLEGKFSSTIESAVKLEVVAAQIRKIVEKQKVQENRALAPIFQFAVDDLFPEESGNLNGAIKSAYSRAKRGNVDDKIDFLNLLTQTGVRQGFLNAMDKYNQGMSLAEEAIAAAFEGRQSSGYDQLKTLQEKSDYIGSILGARDVILDYYAEIQNDEMREILLPTVQRLNGLADICKGRLTNQIKSEIKDKAKQEQVLHKFINTTQRSTRGIIGADKINRVRKNVENKYLGELSKVHTQTNNFATATKTTKVGDLGEYFFAEAMSNEIRALMKKGLNIKFKGGKVKVTGVVAGKDKDKFNVNQKKDVDIMIKQTATGDIKNKIEHLRFSIKSTKNEKKPIKVHNGGSLTTYANRLKSSSVLNSGDFDFLNDNGFWYIYANHLYNNGNSSFLQQIRTMMTRIGFAFIGIDAIEGENSGADFIVVNGKMIPFSSILTRIAESIAAGRGGTRIDATKPNKGLVSNVVNDLQKNKSKYKGQMFYNPLWINDVSSRGYSYASSQKFSIEITATILGL